MTPDRIKQSSAYQVLSPEQTLELADRLGDHSVLYLNPLLAGIRPRDAHLMLGLYEHAVHPYLAGQPGRETNGPLKSPHGDPGSG